MVNRSRRLLALVAPLVACSGGVDIPTLRIATTALPDVRLRDAYDVKVEVTGGAPPYVFSVVDGALPNGIELMAGTGQLLGVAGSPGRASFTVRAADSARAHAELLLTIYVIPDPLEIVTTLLPAGKEGTPYDQRLVARGGVDPLTWSLASGRLPGGVSIAPEGRAFGTPTGFGGFDFRVRATDLEGTSREQDLHLTLTSLNPMIVTSTVEKGRIGQPYSATLVAEGGEPPYSWDLASGGLPPGLALATDGSLAGVPSNAGTFGAMVRVRDAIQRTDLADISVRVIAPLAISTTDLAQAIAARPYDFQLQATGGELPYAWAIGAGTLPSGIGFDASGRFTGASTMIGEYPLTIRVRDAEGFMRSALFDLRVSDRFTYDVTPMLAFPPVCTATTVSYQHAEILVPDSMQVADLNVTIGVRYSGDHGSLRVILFGPDGAQAPLCGNGANIPGGEVCDPGDPNALNGTYDDDGAVANRPERPLAVFDGTNPQGTWRLSVAVVDPICSRMGVIDTVTLSIRDDRSAGPYVIVRGYTQNNLVISPWLRVAGGGVVEDEIFLAATAYDVGPNGFPEGAAGDDVPRSTALTWSWQGTPIPGVTLTPDGRITAGSITGQSSIAATGGGLAVMLPIRVVPPDWNPLVRLF